MRPIPTTAILATPLRTSFLSAHDGWQNGSMTLDSGRTGGFQCGTVGLPLSAGDSTDFGKGYSQPNATLDLCVNVLSRASTHDLRGRRLQTRRGIMKANVCILFKDGNGGMLTLLGRSSVGGVWGSNGIQLTPNIFCRRRWSCRLQELR